jgi:hypothetical protein
MAFQRLNVRMLMLVSGTARWEAVSPEFTLWKLAFEWSWSVVMQNIGTILMAHRFLVRETAKGLTAEQRVEGLADALGHVRCRERITVILVKI